MNLSDCLGMNRDPLESLHSFRVVKGKIITTTVREHLLGVVDAEYEVLEPGRPATPRCKMIVRPLGAPAAASGVSFDQTSVSSNSSASHAGDFDHE